MIEPVDPVQRRELDGFEMTPRPIRRMTSVLNSPITVSAKALSYELPTRPTEGLMPMSASRSLYRIDRYWTPRSVC